MSAMGVLKKDDGWRIPDEPDPPAATEARGDPDRCIHALQHGTHVHRLKDEEAMYQVVGSPAHSKAIARVSLVSRGGTTVTSWQDDERGVSWEKALEQLAWETGPTY